MVDIIFYLTLIIAGFGFYKWRRAVNRIKDMKSDARKISAKIKVREKKIRDGDINPEDPEERAAMRAARRARRRR